MINRSFFVLLVVLFSSFSLLAAEKKLQDPTKPPSFALPKSGPEKVVQLHLSEVRIANQDRRAVVNGQRLKTGDRIAGYRLKRIEIGYVILANEKETLRLNLISSRLIRKKL